MGKLLIKLLMMLSNMSNMSNSLYCPSLWCDERLQIMSYVTKTWCYGVRIRARNITNSREAFQIFEQEDYYDHTVFCFT